MLEDCASCGALSSDLSVGESSGSSIDRLRHSQPRDTAICPLLIVLIFLLVALLIVLRFLLVALLTVLRFPLIATADNTKRITDDVHITKRFPTVVGHTSQLEEKVFPCPFSQDPHNGPV